jgi:Tol biopolymer transport system component
MQSRPLPFRTMRVACALTLTATSFAQSTQRESISSLGSEARRGCGVAVLSADGRVVAFQSDSSDLVVGDTNGRFDAFVHERDTGITARVSLDSAGGQLTRNSWVASVSGDGRFVVFFGDDAHAVSGDTNNASDVFVRDRQLGLTTRVSVATGGGEANGASTGGIVTADGRFVVFTSMATNLVAGDTNGCSDVFVHDRLTTTTTWESMTSSGGLGNGYCGRVALSNDAHYVVFGSDATNLVPNDTNGWPDVFLRDRWIGTTVCVSTDATGAVGDGASDYPTISGDGSTIAFRSHSSLLPGISGSQIFVRDVATWGLGIASKSSAGVPGDNLCDDVSLSLSGRYVAIATQATNLVPGDTNWTADVFRHDRATGQTVLVSVNSAGTVPNDHSYQPTISSDGRFVVFTSYDASFIPGDTNGQLDAFVRDLSGCEPTIASYCTASTSSHGCTPTLGATGAPSASAGSGFTVNASNVDGQRNGLFFFGVAGPLALPLAGGLLCAKPPLQRTSAQTSGGTQGACDGQLALDWNQYVAAHPSAIGAPYVGGETVWIQAWIRDPQSPYSTTLSDALWFQVCP